VSGSDIPTYIAKRLFLIDVSFFAWMGVMKNRIDPKSQRKKNRLPAPEEISPHRARTQSKTI
jgi:hypothetical protein